MKSLVPDPHAPGVFWLGTALGGFYRSIDGGKTWAMPAGANPFPDFSVTAIAPDPTRAGVLWLGLSGVVKGGKLLRSGDGGRTFREVRVWASQAGARAVAVPPRDGPRGWIAVGGDLGVEVSEDAGETWRPASPDLDPGSGVAFLSFHPLRARELYAGSYRHPFLSSDLGRTWNRIANGMVEDTQVFSIDFSPADPGDLWASTCGWVYRSEDAGKKWLRYREGLTDRRSHVVARDPADASRVLVGTTGGLFESRDLGQSFRRISPDVVVNAIAFDRSRPGVVLVGTESAGVLRSEDAGLTLAESNRGLSEARVSAVARAASGVVVVARSADGTRGGLFTLDPETGTAARLETAPPATVVALEASGEALVAATPEGVFRARGPGAAFERTLASPARALAKTPAGLLAGTAEGVYESDDGGASWKRMGRLASRVDGVRAARFPGRKDLTLAADVGGRTLWWNGSDWVFESVRVGGRFELGGGFGRPRAAVRWTPETVGLEIDPARGLLLFRSASLDEGGIALALPEPGLSVAGWSGDPRDASGLFLATMGRGVFRFVPRLAPAEAAEPAIESYRPGTSR